MHRWILKLPYIFIPMLCLVLPVQSDSLRILPDQDFILHVGQRAKLDGVFTIAFKSVLNDSRCPINVTCVWAGNGRVELGNLRHGRQIKDGSTQHKHGTES